MKRSPWWKFSFGLLLLASTNPATATVVRMEFQIGNGTPQNVYVELFDNDTPVTVTNFLRYVDDGAGNHRYQGTFIHRSVAGFVIQGGGFAYDPGLGEFSATSAPHIAEDAPIVNEFLHSNARGTLAMAKVAGDPNSATSEWFFNLANNGGSPNNLDSQNGGFTVFGQVLGGGMSVVDSIAALGVFNLGSAFTQLPLANGYVSPDSVQDRDLVHLNSVEAIGPAARLDAAPIDFDFGLVDPAGAAATTDVIVQNVGTDSLDIHQLGTTDPLAAPFSLSSDNCSNRTLGALESCTVTVTFAPTASGEVADTLDIPSSDTAQPSLSLTVTGFGQANQPTLNILSGAALDMGAVALAASTDRLIVVRNVGTGTLSPAAGAISGVDAASFELVDDACSGVALDVGQTCNLTIRMTGTSEGTKTARITVTASPNAQSTQVDLTGTVRASTAKLTLPDPLPYSAGDIQAGLSKTISVPLTNTGLEVLIISGITTTGVDAADFSVAGVCQRILPGRTCQESVTFSPTAIGAKSAELQIESNDPATPSTSLSLVATASADNDGVSDAIENAGPNGGDANHDGTPDSQQGNVATLPDLYHQYVTLEVPPGNELVGVTAMDNPVPSVPLNAGGKPVVFPAGLYSFSVDNVSPGSVVAVTLRLPAGTRANAYFKYGRQNGSLFPSWYLFDFQNGTGAELHSDRVVLHLRDGGRGDGDGVANGRIVDPGGPALVPSGGGSSSSGGCTLMTNAEASGRHRLDGWLGIGLIWLLRRSKGKRAIV